MPCHWGCQFDAFFARKRKARRSEFFDFLVFSPYFAEVIDDPIKYDAMYFKNETKPLIKLMSDEVARDPEIGIKLQLNFDLEASS